MNQVQEIIRWLLEGDVSVQYQTKRDLLDVEDRNLQDRIAFNHIRARRHHKLSTKWLYLQTTRIVSGQKDTF